MCTDETFFSPMASLEEELIKGTLQYDVYLGNLRRSKSFKVLPHGHMVMLDSDQFNQMKSDTEHNFIRILRKIVGGEKKILPLCLQCNDRGKAEDLIFG